MKRWGFAAKLLLAVAAVLAALAIAVPVVLEKYLPPEKVRAMIVSQASKSLGREVSLSDVTYSLWKGVTLHKLAVSEAPSFKAGSFLEADSFHVRVRWLPLLQKKLEIDSIAADGLRVVIEKRPDGSYNFTQLAGPSSAAPSAGQAAAGAAASVPELSVRRASVSGGRVEYRDLKTNETLVVAPIDAKVSGFALRGAFDAELSLAAKGVAAGRPVDGRVAYSGKIDLGGNDPAKFFAEFKKLVVEQQGLTLQASGKVSGLAAPKAKITASLSGPRGKLLDADVSGAADAAAGSFEGDVNVNTPGFAGSDLAALGVSSTLKVPALKAEGSGSWSGGTLTAKKLHVSGSFGSADASGVVRRFDPKRPDADLDFSAKLALPSLSSKEVPQLGAAVFPASEVDAKGHLANDDVRLDSFHLKNARGTLDASGSLKHLLAAKPDVALTAKADLDLPALRAADVPFMKLPEAFVSPAMAIDGSFKVSADEIALTPLRIKGKGGTVDVSGSIKKLRSEQPEPDLDVKANLDLPALTARDIPSSAVPADFSLPPSKWEVAVAGTLDEVKITTLRLKIGKNDVEIADARVAGLRGRTPLFSVLVKCRSFVLDELKHLTPSTQDMDITGSGFFALEVTGRWPKPILAGKAQFKDLGANVSGLPLTGFTGTASFDERRIDIPNLKGKVADGDLDVDVTIKDYAKRPDIDVEANLTRFDLGKYLAAKTAIVQKKTEAAREETEARHNAEPISTQGRFTVGELVHPNADAHDVKLSWQLTGVTPDMKHLSGSANIKSSAGKFTNLTALAGESKVVKVLTAPLIALVKLGSLGVGLPDLDNLEYSEIGGDYGFENGVMQVNDSHVYSRSANVSATGTIDLPRDELDITANTQAGRVAFPVACKGTLEKPNCKVKVAKALQDTLQNTLQKLIPIPH